MEEDMQNIAKLMKTIYLIYLGGLTYIEAAGIPETYLQFGLNYLILEK